MNANIFKDHLFRNIWEYHVNYQIFNNHYAVAQSLDEYFYWDPEETQYRQIETLIGQLKNNFAFQESFNFVAKEFTNDEMSVISPFVAWFEYINGLSFMEIFIKENHGGGFQINPLLTLVEYVSKIGPFDRQEDPEPVNNGLRVINDVINNFTSSASSLMKRRKNKPTIEIEDEHNMVSKTMHSKKLILTEISSQRRLMVTM